MQTKLHYKYFYERRIYWTSGLKEKRNECLNLNFTLKEKQYESGRYFAP